jgi:hypothetical protein
MVDRIVQRGLTYWHELFHPHLPGDEMQTLKEAHARLPEMRIVLGGYHATFSARNILREYPFIAIS